MQLRPHLGSGGNQQAKEQTNQLVGDVGSVVYD